jgi:hypothetical protein
MQKILLLALLGIFNITQAQDTVKSNAKLTSATVYYGYGAELTHEAKVNVTSAIKQIIIKQLSTTVDANSLQISVPENLMLLSQKIFSFLSYNSSITRQPIGKEFKR